MPTFRKSRKVGQPRHFCDTSNKNQSWASPRALLALLVLISVAAAAGSSKHRRPRAAQGTPGEFDYYLLTLSWSPEFCYSQAHAEKPECQSGHNGFVLHGLWPQYAHGGYPENCSKAPGLANAGEMADIMPDAGLVAHER